MLQGASAFPSAVGCCGASTSEFMYCLESWLTLWRAQQEPAALRAEKEGPRKGSHICAEAQQVLTTRRHVQPVPWGAPWEK